MVAVNLVRFQGNGRGLFHSVTATGMEPKTTPKYPGRWMTAKNPGSDYKSKIYRDEELIERLKNVRSFNES